jgi:hypothetical protein
MNKDDVDTTIKVIQLLSPVIKDVADWMHGGPEPAVLKTLPTTLRAEWALERARLRQID